MIYRNTLIAPHPEPRGLPRLDFTNYQTDGFYDELFEAPGIPRAGARTLARRISELPPGELIQRQKAAEAALLQAGITFAVYGDKSGTEKIFPFDILPRIVESHDWETLERGLKQRTMALNLFITDIYNDQKILKDKVLPEELIKTAKTFRHQLIGFKPPRDLGPHHRHRSRPR